MKIGYMSDLHLEFRHPHPKLLEPCEKGDVLIVAGDLSTAAYCRNSRMDADGRSHRKLIDKVRANIFDQYDLVLYVLGNHEHYNWVFGNTKQTLEEFHAGTNVKILDNSWVRHGGKIFIGATLWSDYMKNSPISKNDCQWGMNDYKIIYRVDPYTMSYTDRRDVSAGCITPDFLLQEHDFSKRFIEHTANHFKDENLVVVTHHGPTMRSLNREHSGNGLDGAYCSDLSDLILGCHNIREWFHGHTHFSTEYMVGDCCVRANQCGYYFEQCFKDFEIKQVEI